MHRVNVFRGIHNIRMIYTRASVRLTGVGARQQAVHYACSIHAAGSVAVMLRYIRYLAPRVPLHEVVTVKVTN